MGCKQNELRNAAGLILKLRIIVAVRSKDQSLYAKFSAPSLLASAPHFICSGNGTGAQAVIWERGHGPEISPMVPGLR